MPKLEKTPFYAAFVDQILVGNNNSAVRSSAEQTLDRYFLSKALGILPPSRSRKGISEDQYQKLWNFALDALGTGTLRARMSGDKNEALSLAQVSVDAATIHMRAVTLLQLRSTNTSDDRGKEIILRAARHQVLAINELYDISGGTEGNRQPDGGTLLSFASQELRYNADTTVALFEQDGYNEVNDAIEANFRRERSTVLISSS